MLAFGMRLSHADYGTVPQIIATTTPKPKPLIKELLSRTQERTAPDGIVDVVLSTGSTFDNAANLPKSFLRTMRRRYDGTRLGEQELYAKLLTGNENAIVKEHWWQVWTDDALPRLDFVILSLDTGYGEEAEKQREKRKNEANPDPDPSACTIWGLFSGDQVRPEGYRPADEAEAHRPGWHDRWNAEPGTGEVDADLQRIILLHAWKGQFEFDELLERVIASIQRYKPDKVYVEAKANGLSVIQELRRRLGRLNVSIERIDPKVDKISRLHACAGIWKEGFVYAPIRSWAQMVIEDLAAFPQSGRDITDTASQAMNKIRLMGAAIYADEQPDETAPPVERRAMY